MTTLYLDIETNMAHDTIWCCVTQQEGTSTVFTDACGLQEAIDLADEVVGHGITDFDSRVLEKVWNVRIPREKMTDTLLLSRLAHADQKRHSLEYWGEELNFPKINFNDYDAGLSDEMIDYCKQDVALTAKLHERLKLSLKKFSQQSIKLEHDVAYILQQQEANGFKLDVDKANDIIVNVMMEMKDITEKLHKIFPPIITPRTSIKTGKKLKDKIEEFNISSRQQIAKRLQQKGIKLKEKTEKGQLIINEKILAEIDTPESNLINRYLLLQKRQSQVESWLKLVTKEGRVHGRVRTNGTVTGRMTHSTPNMAQVPAVNVPFGRECRECWTVDEGNVLVGADASGLELRMLAHYMNDEEYTYEVLSGDIHTANQNAAGLQTRDQAKTFIYAFLYGAGPAKIGQIVGGSYDKGRELIDEFLDNTPALKKLRKSISDIAETGTLKGLDGRRLTVRSKHSSLNTLLQGAGAIVMKQALVILDEALKKHNLPYKFVANVHDEWQIEVPEWAAKAVGYQAVYAIREAGKVLDLNCPLDGEFKIGRNWAETH